MRPKLLRADADGVAVQEVLEVAAGSRSVGVGDEQQQVSRIGIECAAGARHLSVAHCADDQPSGRGEADAGDGLDLVAQTHVGAVEEP